MVIACAVVLGLPWSPSYAEPDQTITLRAWGVPDEYGTDVASQATRAILRDFRRRFPHINPVSSTGLTIPGKTMDIVPLMQIAGDIAPDVLYVNFRQSDTYIRSKFLYPLDKYIEDLAGVEIDNGPALDTDQYLALLSEGPGYAREMHDRVPRQCWTVIRRRCPYRKDCTYSKQRGQPATEEHQHVWAYPVGPLVTSLVYRKDLFTEAGLPDRVPRDWDELYEWSRKLTNPKNDQYGISMSLVELGYGTMNFLYSAGGLIVDQDGQGRWKCTFDSEEAVKAYHFVARLFLEPFENEYGKFDSVVSTGIAGITGELKAAMSFSNIDQRFFAERDPNLYGFGPVPLGPDGKRGGELNSRMVGIYAGLEGDSHAAKRDAAWEYIRFYDGSEARDIRTTVFVNNGLAQYMRPSQLKASGFEEYMGQVPAGWEETFQEALATGVPEPYGRNCQQVYKYLSDAIGQIRTDQAVAGAIRAGDEITAKQRIREILQQQVVFANQRMLNILPPDEKRFRIIIASIVTVAILIVFSFLLYRVFRVFTPEDLRGKGGWQFGKYKWAYLAMLPAIGTIALWIYYPLARGTIMAFQDYNVRGFSQFVGMENFANALFDTAFWHSMWVSLQYAMIFMVFGFAAPILLAILLTEVPRGKLLFRTIYYLPAVLTGIVVIFLWKGFYGPYGLINQILNCVIGLMNHLPHVQFSEIHTTWTDSPRLALFFVLLPTVWAGMGPGCLIYLAALKTIPEEMYEAADVDGAGICAKLVQVTLPSIKALVLINFIGAMIGAMRSGGDFVLAMTGGGPYTPRGQTEVIGLQIFYQAFFYLRFGLATAMAWILGAMLIGFTVMQLQRLSRMEFRAAGSAN